MADGDAGEEAVGVKLASTGETSRGPRPPSAAAHERVARSLRDVLELAAALPSRPSTALSYPRLGQVRP